MVVEKGQREMVELTGMNPWGGGSTRSVTGGSEVWYLSGHSQVGPSRETLRGF